MQIYWIKDRQRCGPAAIPDVLGMVQLGELTPDTLGWHSGCEKWLPLRELPALADYLNEKNDESGDEPKPAAAPPRDPAAPITSVDDFLHVVLPDPSTRLLARLVDMAIYATLALGIMYTFRVPYSIAYMPGSPIFWLPMLIIEALLLSSFRTTPGKRWMGIHFTAVMRPIRPSNGLLRTGLMFVCGLGCMLGYVTLVTLVLSYISIKRRGLVMWDIASGTLPTQAPQKPTVISRVAAVFFLLCAAQLCGRFMMPWMPDMIAELREYAPSMAQMFEQLMHAP